MDARKAAEIFNHHIKELVEIKNSKSLSAVDKKKLNKENNRWLYGTLLVMKKQDIAGIHQDKLIRFAPKETSMRKRNAEVRSPIISDKDTKASRQEK